MIGKTIAHYQITEKIGFDVAPDGRFLIVRATDTRDEEGVQGLVVVQNWFAEFRSAE